MNIITDLHQHQQKFDGTKTGVMPFTIDPLQDAMLSYRAPSFLPLIEPALPDTPFIRQALRNVPVEFRDSLGGGPGYYPYYNIIALLDKSAYHTNPETSYTHSVFHELSHATAKGVLRVTSDYCFEELVAEQCAAMVMDKLGLYEQGRDLHAMYLARYLHVGNFPDPLRTLNEAAEEAQTAFEYMTRRNY